MKHLKSISLLLIAATTFLACKKNGTSNEVLENPTEDLKGTVWAGEFQYTSGVFQNMQPFSIVLEKNNTVTWYENGLSLSGVWSVQGGKITIQYTNGQIVSADVSKNTWNNFTNTGANPRQIANIISSVIPVPGVFENTQWKGKFISGTADISITFLPGSKLRYDAGLPLEVPYTIFGAGVKIGNFAPATNSSSAYIVPLKNALKGNTITSDFGGTYYGSWNATKQ
ncbi:hypothetical protein [Flavitalea sp.]|nr:hypothetical protein [Flavitalea sp.]